MISVIVPVYNVEKYLDECIKSVLAQSFSDFELILVDDGSTDGSGRICSRYAELDSRVRVFHKVNKGLSSARNYGLERAGGEWVIFLDSDDLWNSKDCLKVLYGYATVNSLDILRFEYQAIDDSLNQIEVRRYDKDIIKDRVISNYEMVKYGVAGEWFAVLYLIKREVLDNMRFNENVKFQEDIDFYCRLFSNRPLKCGYVDRRFYLYRKRSASITATPNLDNLKGSFDLCDVFYHQSNITEDSRLKQLYRYYSVMMYYWTLGTLSEEPYFGKRHDIIKRLSLNKLHSATVRRLDNAFVEWKYLPFIKPLPAIGSVLLHYKNILMLNI